MSNYCRGGNVAPNTFAAFDPWDQMIALAGIEEQRRMRIENQLAADAINSANDEQGENDG